MKIFDIVDKKVVININCLLIPELNAVYEEYNSCKINAMSFVHFMSAYESPYENIGLDKAEKIMKDFPGNYNETDPTIKKAINKILELEEIEEDRMFHTAMKTSVIAREKLEGMSQLASTLKELETTMKILERIPVIVKSLDMTRKLRDSAKKVGTKNPNKAIAYDQ